MINTVLFDFDGVLSKDRFYANIAGAYPVIFNFIQEKIFCKDCQIIDRWMRGRMTHKEVNKFISENTGIDFSRLNQLFIESVKAMRLENGLLDLAKKLKESSFRIALVTNNVDVFDEIVRTHKLNSIFPVIINSFNYGVLKHEENGKLFDVAMDVLREEYYGKALLVDDSVKARRAFEQKGGITFAYTQYDGFLKWANTNLLA